MEQHTLFTEASPPPCSFNHFRGKAYKARLGTAKTISWFLLRQNCHCVQTVTTKLWYSTRQLRTDVNFHSICPQSRLNSDCLKSSPESELDEQTITLCGAQSGRFIQIHFVPDEGSDVQWQRLTKQWALQTWCTQSSGTSTRLMESYKFGYYGLSFLTLQ